MTHIAWFLTLPQVMTLDLTGPAETLNLAQGYFQLRYIGPLPPVPASANMTISDAEPLPDTLPEGSLLIVPGVADSRHWLDMPEAMQTCQWLRRLQPAIRAQKVTLICVCSGSLLAAGAGLLDGVQCTTHHNVLDRLRRAAPKALVKENRVFIGDRVIWTSAGITAGIDLSLHLINHLCGARVALEVAREMVVWFRRSADDPQLSPWLRYRNHLHPALHRAQDLLVASSENAWPLPELARQVHVSTRHLTRLFRQHLAITIRDYHEQPRLAVARQRLQQGEGVESAAQAAGFFFCTPAVPGQDRWQLRSPDDTYPAA